MKKLSFLLFCTLLLVSCGEKDLAPSINTPGSQKKTEVAIPTISEISKISVNSETGTTTESLSSIESEINKTEGIAQGSDGIFYNKKGFIVYNAKKCGPNNGLYNGIYNWIDEERKESGCFDKSHYIVEDWGIIPGKERSCFNETNNELTCGGYTYDQFGTYFHDKTGGMYNLVRISKSTNGKLRKIEGATASDGLYGKVLLVGGETFYGPTKLKGVTPTQKLKKISDENGYYFIFTNGYGVWQERTEIEGADASTFKILSNTGMLYIDKNSCYIGLPFYGYNKLEKCNPKSVKVITNKERFLDKDDEKYEYTDDTNIWGQYGAIITK